MTKPPVLFSAAVILILLNGLIWLVFSLIVAAEWHPAMPDSELVRWGMSLLALLNAAALLVLSILLRRRTIIAFYLTLALLFVVLLLTLADDFGLSDLIVLVITLAPIVMLLKERTWYFNRQKSSLP